MHEMEFPPLQFGAKRVNDTLAVAYLLSHQEIYPLGNVASGAQSTKTDYDSCGTKIHYSNPSGDNLKLRWVELQPVKQEYFIKLSEMIKNKAELISQLDYTLRKTNVKVTKLYMSLIEQQSIYWSQFEPDCKLGSVPETLILTAETPLILLGWLPKALYSTGVTIIASKQVAVVARLFTEMCHSAGLVNVMVSFVDDKEIATYAVKKISGCVGVITEKSDMDSAIDSFTWSNMAPWKLKELWIQECIYDDFLLAIKRQCDVNKKDTNTSHTSDAAADKRNILISDDDFSVPMQAYRTSKELISLINSECNSMSLWSSDMSEANEIAFAVSTPTVWINDYGSFYGPPKATQAVFSNIQENTYQFTKTWLTFDKIVVNEFIEKVTSWKKITMEKRKEKIRKVLVDLIAENKTGEFINEVYKVMNEIARPDPYKFIDVENGKICIGVDSISHDIIYFEDVENNEDKCLQVILHGSGCVLNFKSVKPNYAMIFRALYKAGVPAVTTPEANETKAEVDKQKIGVVPYSIYILNTRVIRSNYGTIFAN